MKIVALNGSPRQQGNTAILLQTILNSAKSEGAQTKTIHINDLNIRGCQSCFGCKSAGHCVQNDDMNHIYNEIDSADAVIFASPVYMWEMSAQLKLVIDRLFAYLNPDLSSRIPQGKKAVLVFCQGQPKEDMFQSYFQSVTGMLQMVGFEKPELFVGTACLTPGDINKKTNTIQAAQDLGKTLAK